MACCVPGCNNVLQKWAAELPRDEELLARWKSSIEVGTGHCLTDKTTVQSRASVCNLHFVGYNINDDLERYREPSLFVRNNIQIEVACCRLCLRYDAIDNMLEMDACFVQQSSLHWLTSKYFWLFQLDKERKGYFCNSCTVRIEMTDAFGQKVCEATSEYKRLLQKINIERMLVTRTSVGPKIKQESPENNSPAVRQQFPIQQRIPMCVIVKQEPNAVESEPFRSGKGTEANIFVKQESPAGTEEASGSDSRTQKGVVNSKSTTISDIPEKETNTLETTVVVKTEPGLDDFVIVEKIVVPESFSNTLYDNIKVKDEPHPDTEPDEIETLEDTFVKEESQLAQSIPQQSSEVSDEAQAASDDESGTERKNTKPKSQLRSKCFICDNIMENRKSLEHHLIIDHKVETSHRCEECDLIFNKILHYNRHLAKHDIARPIKCSHCSLRFYIHRDRRHHESLQHESGPGLKKRADIKKPHACSTCGKAYTGVEELKRHETVTHRGEAYARCDTCQKSFSTLNGLRAHLLTHRSKWQFNCKFCDASYPKRYDLVLHNRECAANPNRRIVAHKWERQTHPEILKKSTLPNGQPLASWVGGMKEPMCNVCKVCFKHSKEVVTHFVEAHPDLNLSYFPCPECEKVFFQRACLAGHKTIHTDKYACERCGKRHKSKISLENHRRYQHEVPLDRKILCSICNRQFYRTSNLTVHMRRIHKM